MEVAAARHAEPAGFTVRVSGDKVEDEGGDRVTDLAVTFHVTFPEGPEGGRFRANPPRTVKRSRDRLCTVRRPVEAGAPVTATVAPDARLRPAHARVRKE